MRPTSRARPPRANWSSPIRCSCCAWPTTERAPPCVPTPRPPRPCSPISTSWAPSRAAPITASSTGAACCRPSACAPGDSSIRCRRTFAIYNDAARRSYAMLDQGLRTAILSLHAKGHGIRQIARALRISRGTVRTVLKTGSRTVPRIERAEKAEPYREQILEWVDRCRGNLVRVHEELGAQGVTISYPALTAFCRRHAIGHAPPAPVGHYDFAPAQEMQHDTSPHRAPIGGVEQGIQTASLVLCYSRLLFFQAYPVFTHLYGKVFLTDALEYVTGAAATCMIDNTHVVVAASTGARMVPAPEMAAFAERFGFVFRAHEKGDANRSARVERPFHFIEHNFLAGRTFADLPDLNAQARAFCDKVNATAKRHLHASPRELFATERAHLRPLPLFVSEVYALHHRLVDVEGYVNVQAHRYSVPYLLIGRQLDVRETKDRIDVYHGPRLVASQIVRQELEGHETTEPCVLRFVDHAHSAAAELLDDAVMGEGLADQGV